MEYELTEKEQNIIKVQQALSELEIMGDKFARENADIVRDYIADIEAENQKLKEELLQQLRIAQEKETHRYNKKCICCNKDFIAKRSDTKYCPNCSHKVATKKYRETHKQILAEKSKLNMRRYRERLKRRNKGEVADEQIR